MDYNTNEHKELTCLLIKLIEPDDNLKEDIERRIEEIGIEAFLNSNDFDHFPKTVKDKIYALKNIVEYISKSGAALWLK
ncbi:hypothetical protein [Sporanaerobacter acetigenes]|uniref:Uncharacterized protein n=1 Tax=Sporanaerobacter acetigenes DSM 13106 TaxID=1123281 RepID=A0A1M5UAZ1_9FIRM|nr:hypothetical protein [Sporanaerobacter acetigenes]SHH60078.1 hypothetical protein SAMN02745180_00580 [Sporanaerobacter acetigenes DSM 13106]